jgi:hypothetical protein
MGNLGLGLSLMGRRVQQGAVSNYFGYRWLASQLDDRVEFLNDLPTDNSGIAPANSKRAKFMNRLRPFQCNHDGTGVEFLADDVRVKRDGNPSDLTNPLKLQLVRVPRYWTTSYSDSNNYIYRLFSEQYRSGWEAVNPFGYPRYRGVISGTKLLSYSGILPTANVSLITADAYARNTNGLGRMTPFYIYQNMYWLTVLDTGRFNMQAFYPGITNSGGAYSSAAPTGVMDYLITPSGQKTYEYQAGLFSNPFRWRFIEEFFGQVWNNLGGIYVVWQPGWTLQKVYIATAPGMITTDNNYSGYKLLGEIPKTDGWIKEFVPGTILPSLLGTSSTTGKCDYSYTDPAVTAFVHTVIVGGLSDGGGGAGPGYFNSAWDAGGAHAHVGVSFVLTELPEAAAQPPG